MPEEATREDRMLSYVPADTSSPVLETTVGGILREAAAKAPDTVALVEGVPGERRRWTYAELLRDAERVARALAARFEKAERVAIWAPNIPEWVLVEYGAGLAGVVLVTVNPAYQPKELHYVLSQSRASGIFYLPSFRGNPMEASLRGVLEDLPDVREVISFEKFDDFLASADPSTPLPEVSPDDPVQIQYTSGTTGFPKGAYLHHRGITNNARYVVDRLGLKPGGAYLNPMPLFHTGGCVLGVLGPCQTPATLVNLVQFEPGLMLELAESEKATHMLGVPTMLIALMEHEDFSRRDLSSVTTVCSGGATVPADLVRRIEETLGVQFSIIYGQTEASPGVTLMRPDDSPEDKANTLGPVLPQTELKVIDPETGETVPIGEPGELCCRGYLVMLGYFEMPDKTAETIDEEGWLHTGDLVTMDERGYTTITGRLKDMIIRGGENIYPREIEELLFEHPDVADVAVVGLPDDKWGEIVGAFVRDADPANPASDAELHTYCREHLSPQKTPKVWYHVAEFPLTPSGKIQKFVLLDQWKAGKFDAA
ncbi:MAG: AMP-binding protein [Thermoanaerobaculia bacterium]|nr:AMP-binding protein [Thermoanaerobaculia bacterium]